ncbi:uncharacterized protein LOC117008360 isoform X1 [Catharus ustulatus]|uniref:uncharacterized protein LOC117008360 isoform X1 n=1 Tax=Catharus ustulatus TaxID=91951 RepID=UPI00140ABC5A|nr:uncharacterized protein LOC117008360 isoform X1 [Catharus ustulatus]
MCSRCAPAAEVTLGLSLSPLGHLWVTSGSPLGHLWVRSTPGAPGLVWFVWKTPWRVWGGWKRILQVPEPRSEGKTENSCSSNWISRKTENSFSPGLDFQENREYSCSFSWISRRTENSCSPGLDSQLLLSWISRGTENSCSSSWISRRTENSCSPGLDSQLLLSWISRKTRKFLLTWTGFPGKTGNIPAPLLDFQEKQRISVPLLDFQNTEFLLLWVGFPGKPEISCSSLAFPGSFPAPCPGQLCGFGPCCVPSLSPRCPLVVPSPFRTFFPGVRVGIFGIFPFLLLPCLCLSPEWSCWKCPQAVTGLCPPRGASQESLGIPNSSGILWDLRGRSGAGLILGG